MQSRSRKGVPVKPLPSLVQTAPPPPPPLPPAHTLLLSTQQPGPAAAAAAPAAAYAAAASAAAAAAPALAKANTSLDPQQVERELQSLRSGTHPGYLHALDVLDSQQADHVLAIERLREDRLKNVDDMYIAEMQGLHDQYAEQVEELREKMIEELQARADKAAKSTDMLTRKRAKLTGKDESNRPKKRATVKGIKASLSADEIASDLEKVRALMTGTAGGTRSKSKAQ